MRRMSSTNLSPIFSEIEHEITRGEKNYVFTQRATARICGMDRGTISEGMRQPLPTSEPWRVLGSKLLRSIAAQGISPAGLIKFKHEWEQGQISDLLVSCLITYAATQKQGEKDPAVVALHGALTAGGLRSLLDRSFNLENTFPRAHARDEGITTRNKFVRNYCDNQKNVAAYTAAVTGAITGHPPKTWNKQLLPGQFGDKAGRIRDHADEVTISLIDAAEHGLAFTNVDVKTAAKFAHSIKKSAIELLGYQGPELSPAKLTPRVTRQIVQGKRSAIADADGTMPLLVDGRKKSDAQDVLTEAAVEEVATELLKEVANEQ